ncbi:MAG: CopG family ribbon-helix-helix protein [Cellvibrionaceae bacterium]|nr:CopG family ribbon-helix-helix protein [Cellvibrionaceae bacterium]MCV6624963.1 CopG family ribbon-helix-helix protein [Cellvibrionaceae bacterium]
MSNSVELDKELEGRLQHLASIQDSTPGRIMHKAIREYLDREEAKHKFLQEAIESKAAFEENGRHLTGTEIKDWLASWGTDKETEMPKCHD